MLNSILMATPTRIEPMNANEIFIEWDNGEAYSLPNFNLRIGRGCASCVDEHTGQKILENESVPKNVRPTAVRPVGRYAFSIRFSDGHSTGIYSFEKLLPLCRTSGKLIPRGPKT